MAAKHFLQIILPAPPPQTELFELYKISHDFYREAQYREDLERHCQWYQTVAQQHQREQKKMQGDIKILGWFNRQ